MRGISARPKLLEPPHLPGVSLRGVVEERKTAHLFGRMFRQFCVKTFSDTISASSASTPVPTQVLAHFRGGRLYATAANTLFAFCPLVVALADTSTSPNHRTGYAPPNSLAQRTGFGERGRDAQRDCHHQRIGNQPGTRRPSSRIAQRNARRSQTKTDLPSPH